MCTTTGGTKEIRVCVSRYDQSAQNRRQKVFTRGALRCAGRFDIENLFKSPLIYSVSHFNLGSWGFVCRGEAHQTSPRRRDWIRLNCQSVTKLEMIYVSQAQVWSCINAHPGLPHQKNETGNEWCVKSQLNQTSWNRTVWKFGSKSIKRP